jgi:hypothetical protein
MATNVRSDAPVSVSIERSASQAVSASTNSELHLSPLLVCRRDTGIRGKPHMMPTRGGTEGERVPVLIE